MSGAPCDTCTGCHRPTGLVQTDMPTETDFVFGGVFVKMWTVEEAGTTLGQYSHPFPHMTFVSAGAVRAWRDGDYLGEFRAPAAVEIPAFAKHEFTTLEPGTTILCLHNIADGSQPLVADESRFSEREV